MSQFPPIAPRRSGVLNVDPPHRLYWEELGNPDGVPIVFLHGGPGGGTPDAYRRHFDPDFHRIILFDQRGAGRSTPLGETRGNDTAALIADIERLRSHLGVDRWAVAGASWGSTLALAYGQAHPGSCLGFLLRGLFMGTAAEIDWVMYGMGRFFPEAWDALAAHVAPRTDLLAAYAERLEDPVTCHAAALAWSRYEGACSLLLPSAEAEESFADPDHALSLGRIEIHYFRNRLFLEEGQLRANLSRIAHLPAVIVNGRYDMLCPPATAAALARDWPGAELILIPDGGHSGLDPAMAAAQIRGARRLKEMLT